MVSIPEQKLYVYRGLDLIETSAVSTGKPDHPTPTGVFTIIDKERYHHSNIYSGAPMPFMQRITWSGVALHEGVVPRHPASHGCIRLPAAFAKKLYGMTRVGAHVIVISGRTEPEAVGHPALFQPAAPDQLLGSGEGSRRLRLEVRDRLSVDVDSLANLASPLPRRSDSPLRILVTPRTMAVRVKEAQILLTGLGFNAGDPDGAVGEQTAAAIRVYQERSGLPKTGEVTDALIDSLRKAAGQPPASNGYIYVKQDYKMLFEGPVEIADPSRPLGTHLFQMLHFAPGDASAQWITLPGVEEPKVAATDALHRITIPEETRRRIAALLTPRSSFILTDYAMSDETDDSTDFVVKTRSHAGASKLATEAADPGVCQDCAKPRKRKRAVAKPGGSLGFVGQAWFKTGTSVSRR